MKEESDRFGYVALHRKIIDSKLWSCSDSTFKVAIYLMLEANHKPRFHREILIERGQTIRSLTRISDDCNLTRKTVRTIIKKLTDDKFILIDEPFGAQQGHRITICKYATYQDDKNKKGTQRAHEVSNEVSTNNNVYKENNGNNKYSHLIKNLSDENQKLYKGWCEVSGYPHVTQQDIALGDLLRVPEEYRADSIKKSTLKPYPTFYDPRKQSWQEPAQDKNKKKDYRLKKD